MKGIIKTRRAAYRAAAVAAGLNVSRGYFELNSDDFCKLRELADIFKFTSKSAIGRSRLQAFWYAIQAGE